MVKKVTDQTIEEAGASEGSLAPGAGTAAGDVKMNTIADIVARLGSLGEDDFNGFMKSLALYGPGKYGADESDKNKKTIEAKQPAAAVKAMVKEDLDKIFGSESIETPLSEAFINNATTLFEAALSTRLALEVETIEEQMNTQLEEAIDKTIVEMTERVDAYMEHLAEEYMTKNELAIQSGIKTELSESFIVGMKNVFLQHNVTIPEADVDIIASLNEQVEDLSDRLNKATGLLIESKKIETDAEISIVLKSISEGMTEVNKDRLALVAESMDYDNIEDFETKIKLVKENLFEKTPTSKDSNGLLIEEVGVISEEEINNEPALTGKMAAYAAALTKR